MDGLLVVDKPAGPTSHDVVARVRRALGERRVGHWHARPGATGVLPRSRRATQSPVPRRQRPGMRRLCAWGGDRHADATGTPMARLSRCGALKAIDRALTRLRDVCAATALSAKKIGANGYRAARRAKREAAVLPGLSALPALPVPVNVTARAIDIVSVDGDCVTLHVHCSAGFYVRALAHDLGARLGTGGHLLTLRRTRSGDMTIDRALPLDAIEREPDMATRSVVPLSKMLPGLSSVTLTSEGIRHAVHGQDLGPGDTEQGTAALQQRSRKWTIPLVRAARRFGRRSCRHRDPGRRVRAFAPRGCSGVTC